ncbi:DNA polymerase lambda isoform X2 [Malania oleifera]|uniref:DNA polymerase lambda isoform X2 n=1 Tax=Malania oleifera TaxID=397392 RepID=UPI0025AECCB7|nr:DNA polymerase lambda isoform X2 [Malania oleifera]
MAPRASKNRNPPSDPHGMFSGMVVFLFENGVQSRRLQIWKQRLAQMGATIEDRLSKNVTHVLAVNSDVLLKQSVLTYQWLEDSLSLGEKKSEGSYYLNLELERNVAKNNSNADEPSQCKKIRPSLEDSKIVNAQSRNSTSHTSSYTPASSRDSRDSSHSPSAQTSCPDTSDSLNKTVEALHQQLPYNPPDLNRNITDIFGKLTNIYRALGDDRRSFSYHKAIAVIEKLPFKIESADQVKDLPTIGKSMKDHIQEIVSTGKLSKLEHFETDEKVKTITLFGEVWGIGPATALKLYEKGHRTLDDLKDEDSLTNAQKLGLKYFDDIKEKIPRHEVQEMEHLLQKAGEDVLSGVVVLCGGSFRRGKASCGDLDIIITHPDGKSHRGFLPKFVEHLKDMTFLREDLIFSIHSEEDTDSGVDTYFGFCTYPGRELRHRIDFKVYPKDIYAFGLIAWTGNDVLNRRLRLLAESKGYKLDDTGLFPATQGSGGKRGTRASKSMSFYTEREVFEFLGFPWLEPHDRNL